jgi:aspartyl-tRNA(Asn)/glutamyl-tRNA(Gln) amidotransferase subunit B
MTSNWIPTIGLEVHCELATQTKLWCSCPNKFGAEPNTMVCPVCLGLPGTLPVLNEKAVEMAIAIGKALNCRVQTSLFHRKNYFYPDMPKNYQISQYDIPINADGYIELFDGTKIGIIRAHLEEDTGKTSHIGSSGRINEAKGSLIDYNRAGVPLVEIVSAPEIKSAEQAGQYVSVLRTILLSTKATDAKMQEGSLRVDANISVADKGSEILGTRCEIKNLNSIRSLVRAIKYEIDRQIDLLEKGGNVVQETRHWNEGTQKTEVLRTKEEADDYRYFPDPDLVPLKPLEDWINKVVQDPIRSPKELFDSIKGLLPDVTDSGIIGLIENNLGSKLMQIIQMGADTKIAFNRLSNEAAQSPEAALEVPNEYFVKVINMENDGLISSTQAKAVILSMIETKKAPEVIIKNLGFEQMDLLDLEELLTNLIDQNRDEWQKLLEGNEKLRQFFIGRIMKETKGKANGKILKDIMDRKIKEAAGN